MNRAPMPHELLTRVEAWLSEDPDPTTRAELERLLQKGDEVALRERFDNPLSFGTAGIRGPLGAGPARFNRAVVRKTTAGLVRYLREGPPGGTVSPTDLPPAWATAVPLTAPPPAWATAVPLTAPAPAGLDVPPAPAGGAVVVGHDARYGSENFAKDAARVLAAGGLRALHLKSALPTPITAFAVRHFGACAGVMVTASHNPAADNGYKVYLADGAQVIPPHDAAIAAYAGASAVPRDEELMGPFGNSLETVDEAELLANYRSSVTTLLAPNGPRGLRCVYSPLHGVGGAVLPGLMEEAGFEPPATVQEQAAPDPDFPTAPFPNPEEPGVMDLALALAEKAGADLVLVNDPDADRLAVAVQQERGRHRVLTGDELGVLIADHLISSSEGPGRLVATTVVSSTMLAKMAEHAGVAYIETLTGFKWIARAARLRPRHRLLFGYEEALGYAVTEAVADKDGLSAALVVAEMAAAAKAEGRSLLDRLDELAARFGAHATAQWSLRLDGSGAASELAGVMERWRSAPPQRLSGMPVSGVRDLSAGERELPPSDVLILELGDAGRVVLRPSGTEPKLKVYFEATTAPCDLGDLPEARREAQATLDRLRLAVASQVEADLAGERRST